MNKKDDLERMAILDTNSLHFMGVYFAHSKKHKYPSIHEVKKTELKHRLDIEKKKENLDDKYIEAVRKGSGVIDFLRTSNIRVECSSISELELILGRVRGAALIAAAHEGIPDRMWSQFREKEVRERMDVKKIQKIRGGIEEIYETLEKLDITVGGNNPSQAISVLDLAKEIVSLVYMAGMDSIVYAETLLSRADFLITFDYKLREVVKNVYAPSGNPHYQHIASELKKCVRRATLLDELDIESLDISLDIELPDVPEVPW